MIEFVKYCRDLLLPATKDVIGLRVQIFREKTRKIHQLTLDAKTKLGILRVSEVCCNRFVNQNDLKWKVLYKQEVHQLLMLLVPCKNYVKMTIFIMLIKQHSFLNYYLAEPNI